MEPLAKGKNTYSFTQDTYENKWTPYCARLSAGGTLGLLDAIRDEEVKRGFAIVRPPGHHAHSSMASGFCFFNNVAVAARYAQEHCGWKKVCIFDWDVHFGDGTSKIFLNDDSVLFISLHRF